MYGAGIPGWVMGLVLALVFCAAAIVVSVVTGFFLMLVPALMVVALGFGIYLLVAARRRRGFAFDWVRIGVIEDGRAMRRRSRLRRR